MPMVHLSVFSFTGNSLRDDLYVWADKQPVAGWGVQGTLEHIIAINQALNVTRQAISSALESELKETNT